MPIDSMAKRQAAFMLGDPIVPDASIGEEDRAVILACYPFLVSVVAAFAMNLYVEMARTVITGDDEAAGMKISQSRTKNAYIEKAKSLDVGIL
jgi:hypothetical protein